MVRLVEIVVSQEIIEEGIQWSRMFCPIGLALSTALPSEIKEVSLLGIRLFGGGLIPLSEPLMEWIYRFDHYGEGKPFHFFLEI